MAVVIVVVVEGDGVATTAATASTIDGAGMQPCRFVVAILCHQQTN